MSIVCRPWTPMDVGGVSAWFDAPDASTITLNGSNVSQCDDKSGNGKDLLQATAARQPEYVSSVYNGLNTIRFVRVNNKSLVRLAIDVSIRTLFIVSKVETFGHSYLADFRSGIADSYIWGNAIGPYWTSYWRNGELRNPPIPADIYNNTFQVNVFEGSSTGTAGLEFSKWDAGITGDISEIIIFDKILSNAERQLVTSYLTLKYAL